MQIFNLNPSPEAPVAGLRGGGAATSLPPNSPAPDSHDSHCFALAPSQAWRGRQIVAPFTGSALLFDGVIKEV